MPNSERSKRYHGQLHQRVVARMRRRRRPMSSTCNTNWGIYGILAHQIKVPWNAVMPRNTAERDHWSEMRADVVEWLYANVGDGKFAMTGFSDAEGDEFTVVYLAFDSLEHATLFLLRWFDEGVG